MDNKYLQLLAKEYPNIDSVASEMVNLSAIRSLPKGTEYYFSDLHGEYEAFLHMLKSASGIIKKKIDQVLGKTVSNEEREKLANLIYYPDKEIKLLAADNRITDEWKRLTIYRLILVCEAVSAKYTRSRVRKCVSKDLVYILDELLNVTDDVDIQWGNHDISWIGAASGNYALIANVIRISMRYNNFDILEDGYGLNLRALAVFAGEAYKDDECRLYFPNTLDDNIYDPVDAALVAKMHKAITVIQLKLEGRLMEKYPEWEMQNRSLFCRVDFENFTLQLNGKEYVLTDKYFPTVDKKNPLALSEGEQELMAILANSFSHSEKLQEHIRFLLAKGSMYRVCNGNLLFHGCIPMDGKGELQSVAIDGACYSGKALLDKLDEIVNRAYFFGKQPAEKEYACDFLWYLWCGPKSPLFGKDKMSFFESYYLEEESLRKENYNSYYRFSESVEVCNKILHMFGVDEDSGHIINGHVPVKIKNGESPVKAGGKLFVIDGGISKAYQKATGIAGYTLIYDSHSLSLAEHKPFISGKSEHTPKIQLVEKLESRANISDTDVGKDILEKIEDLRQLLSAYRAGTMKERC